MSPPSILSRLNPWPVNGAIVGDIVGAPVEGEDLLELDDLVGTSMPAVPFVVFARIPLRGAHNLLASADSPAMNTEVSRDSDLVFEGHFVYLMNLSLKVNSGERDRNHELMISSAPHVVRSHVESGWSKVALLQRQVRFEREPQTSKTPLSRWQVC